MYSGKLVEFFKKKNINITEGYSQLNKAQCLEIISLINNEQTLFKYIMIGYYNIIKKLLNYVYIHDIYCKNFCVNNFNYCKI